jgi:DNA-binding NarL/FixJ family response regulator
MAAMRVVIAEDMVLLRQGLSRLLAEEGMEVLAEVADADSLLAAVSTHQPDVALIDIKLPPAWTDEGVRAALQIRAEHPKTAVLLLSSYLDSRFAEQLLATRATSCGYLLKDHVADPAVLLDAIHRVSNGESVVDPAVIKSLLRRKRAAGPLDQLTNRQREILGLMAEGYSNSRICQQLYLSPRTVESHVRSIFTTLGLSETADGSRRVLAVLAYLRA